jgi:hypothetical protein
MSPRPLNLVVGWWSPAARSRLVTGRSRRGGSYAGTSGHAQSRRRWLGHGRHGAGPAARASPVGHAGVARPRMPSRLRDPVAMRGTCRRVRLSSPSLPSPFASVALPALRFPSAQALRFGRVAHLAATPRSPSKVSTPLPRSRASPPPARRRQDNFAQFFLSFFSMLHTYHHPFC